MDRELVPFSEIESSGFDLNLAVEQGQQTRKIFREIGIKEATFDNGTYYRDDRENNTTTIAAEGILMQQNEHTTTVVFRNEGSTKEQSLKELSSTPSTQKTLGAFSGISQQQVSQMLLENNED